MSDQTRNTTFRNLSNYKAQHAKTAETKNVYDRFMNARTLTMARGILFGFKSRRGNHGVSRMG